MIWTSRIALPRWLHRPLMTVAASTLFIYICNVAIVNLMNYAGIPGGWPAQVAVTFAVGIGLTAAWDALVRLISRVWNQYNNRFAGLLGSG